MNFVSSLPQIGTRLSHPECFRSGASRKGKLSERNPLINQTDQPETGLLLRARSIAAAKRLVIACGCVIAAPTTTA